jgi:hypothetical protein
MASFFNALSELKPENILNKDGVAITAESLSGTST